MILSYIGIGSTLCLVAFLYGRRKDLFHPPARKFKVSKKRRRGDTVDVGTITGSDNKVHITHDYTGDGKLTPREEMLRAFVEDFKGTNKILMDEKLAMRNQLFQALKENGELRERLAKYEGGRAPLPQLLVKKVEISVS